jgi:hypothetical protein
MGFFDSQFGLITGGTYVNQLPALQTNSTFKLKGITYTAFTNQSTFQNVTTIREDYPIDDDGYPKSPVETENNFFQKGAGWYEQTPDHRSSEELVITGLNYSGQNTEIQTQLKPFNYGEDYLSVYKKFPYINDGFKLRRTIDNNKSWVATDNKIRLTTDANYNALYYIEDERLVLNIKNIDLFLNPGRGLAYEIWEQSVKYNYPIPESGLTVNYPSPGGVDSTVIKPEPKKKTFFEFNQTFWKNMINVRNRQFITDGKTGGYPTLQSLYWRYIDQLQNIGIQNNQYTYQKLIDYVNGLGPFWMKLLDQMIPATTIWQGGTRFENSVLHKQKFVYRRQRGCEIVERPKIPCQSISNIFNFNGYSESVTFFIYPWLNENANPLIQSFSAILSAQVEAALNANGTSIATCNNINSLQTTWYVNLKVGNNVLVNYPFFQGLGLVGVPSNTQWKSALIASLPNILDNNLNYYFQGNQITIINLSNQQLFANQVVTLSVGIDINVNC